MASIGSARILWPRCLPRLVLLTGNKQKGHTLLSNSWIFAPFLRFIQNTNDKSILIVTDIHTHTDNIRGHLLLYGWPQQWFNPFRDLYNDQCIGGQHVLQFRYSLSCLTITSRD